MRTTVLLLCTDESDMLRHSLPAAAGQEGADVVVVDNASTDDTESLAREHGARYERLEHYMRAQNAAIGGRCGFQYGEFFTLPTPIGTKDFMATVQGGAATPTPVQLPGQDHLPLA